VDSVLERNRWRCCTKLVSSLDIGRRNLCIHLHNIYSNITQLRKPVLLCLVKIVFIWSFTGLQCMLSTWQQHLFTLDKQLFCAVQLRRLDTGGYVPFLYFEYNTIKQIVSESSIVLWFRLFVFFFNNNSISFCEQASNGSDNEMLSPVTHVHNSNISDTLILVCRKIFWNIYEYSRCPSIRFYKCTNTSSRRKLRHWHISGHTLKDRSNEQLHEARLHTWIHRKSDVKQVNVSVKCNQ